MIGLTHDFEKYAFSVVLRTAATGYYSFAHEFGHNIGSHHDWPTTSDIGVYKYSKGYQGTAKAVSNNYVYQCPRLYAVEITGPIQMSIT